MKQSCNFRKNKEPVGLHNVTNLVKTAQPMDLELCLDQWSEQKKAKKKPKKKSVKEKIVETKPVIEVTGIGTAEYLAEKDKKNMNDSHDDVIILESNEDKGIFCVNSSDFFFKFFFSVKIEISDSEEDDVIILGSETQ